MKKYEGLLQRLNEAFDRIEMGEVYYEWTQSSEPKSAAHPMSVTFFIENVVVGKLYFLETPMKLCVYDEKFVDVAESLKTELNLN